MEVYYLYKHNFMFHANPLLTVAMLIEIIVFAFLFNNPVYLCVLLLNLVLISIVSQTLKKCLKFVKYIGIIGVFVLILNMLLNRQGTTVILFIQTSLPIFGYIVFTAETIVYSLISILQLVVIMYSFALMNIIVNPDDFMKLMLKIRMPYVMALLITLTIRFFPQLVNDLKDITDVQRSRGFEIDKGSWFTRIKNRMILLLPLLTNSLERSIQVSEALEARAFRITPEKSRRSKPKSNQNKATSNQIKTESNNENPKKEFYQELKVGGLEKIGLITLFIEFIFLFYAGMQKYGAYVVFPTLSPLPFTWVDLLILAFLFIITTINIIIIKSASRKAMAEVVS
jgi:energy-coupling factor transport system permease protein